MDERLIEFLNNGLNLKKDVTPLEDDKTNKKLIINTNNINGKRENKDIANSKNSLNTNTNNELDNKKLITSLENFTTTNNTQCVIFNNILFKNNVKSNNGIFFALKSDNVDYSNDFYIFDLKKEFITHKEETQELENTNVQHYKIYNSNINLAENQNHDTNDSFKIKNFFIIASDTAESLYILFTNESKCLFAKCNIIEGSLKYMNVINGILMNCPSKKSIDGYIDIIVAENTKVPNEDLTYSKVRFSVIDFSTEKTEYFYPFGTMENDMIDIVKLDNENISDYENYYGVCILYRNVVFKFSNIKIDVIGLFDKNSQFIDMMHMDTCGSYDPKNNACIFYCDLNTENYKILTENTGFYTNYNKKNHALLNIKPIEIENLLDGCDSEVTIVYLLDKYITNFFDRKNPKINDNIKKLENDGNSHNVNIDTDATENIVEILKSVNNLKINNTKNINITKNNNDSKKIKLNIKKDTSQSNNFIEYDLDYIPPDVNDIIKLGGFNTIDKAIQNIKPKKKEKSKVNISKSLNSILGYNSTDNLKIFDENIMFDKEKILEEKKRDGIHCSSCIFTKENDNLLINKDLIAKEVSEKIKIEVLREIKEILKIKNEFNTESKISLWNKPHLNLNSKALNLLNEKDYITFTDIFAKLMLSKIFIESCKKQIKKLGSVETRYIRRFDRTCENIQKAIPKLYNNDIRFNMDDILGISINTSINDAFGIKKNEFDVKTIKVIFSAFSYFSSSYDTVSLVYLPSHCLFYLFVVAHTHGCFFESDFYKNIVISLNPQCLNIIEQSKALNNLGNVINQDYKKQIRSSNFESALHVIKILLESRKKLNEGECRLYVLVSKKLQKIE